ncbi:hypothetical protein Tco_1264599 [Tanacetum coccineum]
MIDSQMDDMIREKLALKEQVDSLEQNLSKQIKETESVLQTFAVFKNESKEKENKYMENEIDLEKKIKELDNIICKVGQSAQTVHMLTKPQAFYDNTHKQALGYQNPFYLKKAQRIKPTLYDGVVMSNAHVSMPVIDDEETLILEEESRSKMSEKAKDPEVIAKKISHKPIDYEKLNRLTEDFGKRFSPQQELSAEQAFWFHILNPTIEPPYTPPVIVDVPSELPKRTTPSALKEGEWGFEHTKTVFNNEIIPFLNFLKDIFNVFDKDLLNEIMEVQIVFDQMEVVVQQSLVDKQCLEIAKKEILLENDRLLQKIMSQDVLLTVMNSMSLNNDSVNMEMQKCESCKKCLNLDAELSKSKQAYNDFLKNYSQLEKHCISLEASMQLQQEVFQNDESCVNQNAVEIQEYFEINDLKARLQDKDKTICKLKDTIKSLRENTKEENVNHDKCDLEPINKELENSVAKLLSENERLCNEINHVKQVFKDQFDSIKQTRVRHKEQRKEIVENVVHTPSATTIAPGMFKLDLVPLPPRLLQNRDVHIDYLRHTQEQANTLRELVEQAKAKQPLDRELDFAYKTGHVLLSTMYNAAFQTEDLDPYDSDCNDLSTAQVVLMANISNYDSDVISEVPNSETYLNDMDNQSLHTLQDFEKSPVKDFTDNEISSDSNIIPYSQYLQETQQATVQDTNLQAQQDSEKANKEQNNESITDELERYKERVKTFEQRLNIDLSSHEKMIDSQMDDMIREKLALKEQIDSLEQNLSKQIKEMESLFKTFTVFKNESKEKERIKIYGKVKLIWKRRLRSFKDQFDSIKQTRVRHKEQCLDLVTVAYLGCPDCTLILRNGHPNCKDYEYGDYQLGNVVISRVYYVEALGHNLFSVGQFCDADLEVSFRKNTCFIRNLEGVDLLLGSRDTNLYTISLDDMLKSSPVYLLSKVSNNKSWLWHC